MIRANEEIVKVKRSGEGEMAVLQAALRKAEMQAQSLEQTVEQKVCFCYGHFSLIVTDFDAFVPMFLNSNVNRTLHIDVYFYRRITLM